MIAAPPDRELARLIIGFLESQGYEAVSGPAPRELRPLAVVVVLSPAALVDPQWQADTQGMRGFRMVPVAVDTDVDYETAPGYLAELNWIIWSQRSPGESAGLLVRGINTDLGAYRNQRSLESRALSWQATDFDDQALLSGVGICRAAAAEFASARPGLQPENSQLVARYLESSMRRSRKARRRIRWRLARSLVIVVLCLTLPWLLANYKAGSEQTRKLILMSDDSLQSVYPDVTAIVSVAALDRLDGSAREQAFARLIAALGQTGDTGQIGWRGDTGITDVALTADPNVAYTVDGDGAVSAWDVPDGAVTWRRKASGSPLYVIRASEGGRHLAVAGVEPAIKIIDTKSWQVTTKRLPNPALDIGLSRDGTFACTSTASGLLTPLRTGASGSVGPTVKFDKVLDLGPLGERSVAALVREGPDLMLIDVATGRVISRDRFAAAEFQAGAIGPDGRSIAVTGTDGQLWVAEKGLDLQPTGQSVPDLVTTIDLNDEGWVAFGSDQDGVQVLIPRDGVVLGPICRGMGSAHVVVIRGRSGVCGPLWLTYDLAAFGYDEPPSDSEEAELGRGGQSVSRDGPHLSAIIDKAAGSVSWTVDTATTSRQDSGQLMFSVPGFATGTRATALAVNSNGTSLAVGTNSDMVVEYDFVRAGGTGPYAPVEVRRFVARSGSVVSRVGYLAGGTVIAETDDGRWHRFTSCASCASDSARLWEVVRDRRRNVYADGFVDDLPERVVQRLDIRRFPEMPAAAAEN